MSTNMPVFVDGSRLSQDACALKAREFQNQAIIDYNTFNFYPAVTNNSELETAALNNRNLRYRIGVGIADSYLIDKDSELRFQKDVRPPERNQLCTRVFHAIPNLSRGIPMTNLESMLVQGISTSKMDDCHKLAEIGYEFMPMTDCMLNYVNNAANVLPNQYLYGQSSKEEYLQQRKACHMPQK